MNLRRKLKALSTPKPEAPSWESENDLRLLAALNAENQIMREALNRAATSPRSARLIANQAIEECKKVRLRPAQYSVRP